MRIPFRGIRGGAESLTPLFNDVIGGFGLSVLFSHFESTTNLRETRVCQCPCVTVESVGYAATFEPQARAGEACCQELF